jgi:hypothetical protein
MEETMRRSGSAPIWAIVGMAAAIAFVGWMAAESMRTTALTTKEAISQNQAVETSAGAKAEVEPTKFEITPSPVIEPNPKFFVGTGDGSSGSYEEPQHR